MGTVTLTLPRGVDVELGAAMVAEATVLPLGPVAENTMVASSVESVSEKVKTSDVGPGLFWL